MIEIRVIESKLLLGTIKVIGGVWVADKPVETIALCAEFNGETLESLDGWTNGYVVAELVA